MKVAEWWVDVQGKLAHKPNWREGSPEEAHAWLMHKKELSEEKCKRIRPMYGSRSYLALETRPEDDPAIPFRARVGKHMRDKVLTKNGGVAPELGHKHYNAYRVFCKACDGYE
ncbi:g12669 [Coccomyxa viridis]|uniref:G12669 protein n=1 Tax=Coccomyxa viridis TaxID=1274662 RepID=A0ABP1GGF6_9CHLO